MYPRITSIPRNSKLLLCITALQCLLWSVYLVWFKPLFADSFTEAVIRSIVRVSIVGIPALLYIHFYKKDNLKDYFSTQNLRFALKLGFVACLVILFFFLPKLPSFQFPVDFPAWMNWIIGSPLVEELYFRAIVLKELTKCYRPTSSVIVSSLLFLALHLPQWLFHHNLDLVSLSLIFIYGIGFSLLWLKSKSIFATLLPHCLNNFLFMATSAIR